MAAELDQNCGRLYKFVPLTKLVQIFYESRIEEAKVEKLLSQHDVNF
ncbi:hypothetical protein QHH11_12195 [Aphanizomenon sp. PH219]|uniref:Uncharacterized protein n=1 Tax=Dolichospermum heterosporum TAC447 TaxID=747523 RepID=A0ABY5M3I6_9CYAN|nr:hypothetical protein [Dolichospermum heterosporum]MDK2459889.1 hypothetical protein [Aphanizomenon sp. PH219]UUO17637.1 hypothetical protein NG743_11985 [Dolichospermum heterosporum TAC447]